METTEQLELSQEPVSPPPPPTRSSRKSSSGNSVLASMSISQMDALNLDELRELARSAEITGYTRLKKTDLIMRLLRANAEQQGYIFGGGILEIVADGIGFLRSERLLPGSEDVYVSQSQIRRFGLRTRPSLSEE